MLLVFLNFSFKVAYENNAKFLINEKNNLADQLVIDTNNEYRQIKDILNRKIVIFNRIIFKLVFYKTFSYSG